MRTRNILSFSAILFLFSACSTLYVPNQPQVLLMSEGDETQVGLQVGTNGYGAKLAYSPYYHWALMANGNTFSFVQDSNYTIRQKHTYGEIGTGYYTRLNKYWRFEALVGYGGGSSGLTNERGHYRRAFFQPSVGVSGPFFDGALTTRLAWVNQFSQEVGGLRSDVNLSSVFLEPYVTLRAGWEQIKFQFQTGFSFDLGNAGFSTRSYTAALGVHVTLFKDFDKY